ncbi:U2 small nuclear ribonucleoprotein A' [Exaiptasia diaphana]|uniref:U2A'/phosphoprotein 32 family A C-terminal domain-containing protein n=1 Tax=Exaiptasia diaphana TaxID=2652724 RepID=A0A913YBV3_EXADI|nr:U2 small nuclear ribonucleoprotein A' [Exaiptasia diaphana]
MKITADLILQCSQYTNAVKDRELDLRGYKISVIENMGATLDQFDTIDLSDNDIRKIEGFPLLKRLKCLIFNNNRICIAAIKAAIANATSLDEVQRLEMLLKAGQVPGSERRNNNDQEEMEITNGK